MPRGKRTGAAKAARPLPKLHRAPYPKLAKPLPPGYGRLLADIKSRIHTAQLRAALAANQELVQLYWDIGRLILGRQEQQGWGAKVIDRLAADLKRSFPEMQGFSPRNLKYMRAFA